MNAESAPKPRKFFKSRNIAPAFSPDNHIQNQLSYQQSNQIDSPNSKQSNAALNSNDADNSKVKSKKKKSKVAVEKAPKTEKLAKPKKEKNVKINTSPDKLNDKNNHPSSSQDRPTSTRVLSRTRHKVINYNEDADEEEFIKKIERKQYCPSKNLIATITESAGDVISHTKIDHPPIVLRISKVRNFFF